MYPKKWRIGIGILLSALICGLVCVACLLNDPLSWFLAYRQRAALDHANRLDQVIGEVEPLFLAEDQKMHPSLSPDGKWIALTEPKGGDNERDYWMMEVETYHLHRLKNVNGGTWQWLDNHYFRAGRTIIRVPELVLWQLDHLSFKNNPDALVQLKGTKQVMAIEGEIARGYVLVSNDPTYPYLVDMDVMDEVELVEKLGDIPYTIVPESVWRIHRGRDTPRIYSPDGNYFVSGGTYSEEEDTYYPQPLDGKFQKLVCCPTGIIFDAQTEKMVALADKEGWSARVLGWASDSSGVYLQFLLLGRVFSPSPAGFPSYKLLVPGQQPSGKVPILVDVPQY